MNRRGRRSLTPRRSSFVLRKVVAMLLWQWRMCDIKLGQTQLYSSGGGCSKNCRIDGVFANFPGNKLQIHLFYFLPPSKRNERKIKQQWWKKSILKLFFLCNNKYNKIYLVVIFRKRNYKTPKNRVLYSSPRVVAETLLLAQ